MLDLIYGLLVFGSPALKFDSVICSYSISDKVEKTVTQKLMTLAIDSDFGRFAQIQFGDETRKIQYQILLENDVKKKTSVNILQNLLVDDLESSAEFSASAPQYVRIRQGAHMVRCELVKPVASPVADQN